MSLNYNRVNFGKISQFTLAIRDRSGIFELPRSLPLKVKSLIDEVLLYSISYVLCVLCIVNLCIV